MDCPTRINFQPTPKNTIPESPMAPEKNPPPTPTRVILPDKTRGQSHAESPDDQSSVGVDARR